MDQGDYRRWQERRDDILDLMTPSPNVPERPWSSNGHRKRESWLDEFPELHRPPTAPEIRQLATILDNAGLGQPGQGGRLDPIPGPRKKPYLTEINKYCYEVMTAWSHAGGRQSMALLMSTKLRLSHCIASMPVIMLIVGKGERERALEAVPYNFLHQVAAFRMIGEGSFWGPGSF